MNITPIETSYAGCRFRSRLEARWAVVFDELGIRWEYEAQGVRCTTRLEQGPEDTSFPYLPDFWLPDMNAFAEVKGSLSDDECRKLLNAAASISSRDQCGTATGPDLIVCGPIDLPILESHYGEFPYLVSYPIVLWFHKGSLFGDPWFFEPKTMDGRWEVAQDCFGIGDLSRISKDLVEGWLASATARTASALIAGRKARFEHGETP